MQPVSFPEQNCVYKKDGCLDLPAIQVKSEQFQALEIISCWEFSDEEVELMIEQIKAGQKPKIFLSVIGGQPPVALWVRGE